MPITPPIVRAADGTQTTPYTMAVKPEGGDIVSLISSPPSMTHDGGVWSVAETARPGRAPLAHASAPGLRRLSFEHTIASRTPNISVENEIKDLRSVAHSGKRVQFYGAGGLASGVWWLVTGFTVTEVTVTEHNFASHATIRWECIEAKTVSAVEMSKTGIKKGTLTVVKVG